MGFWQLVRRAKEFWSWYSFAVGTLGLAVTGVGIAVGGAVWLLKSGVPLPIAIMAGYCTLVGAVYLTMAPLAYRALKQEPSKKSKKVSPKIWWQLDYSINMRLAPRLDFG